VKIPVWWNYYVPFEAMLTDEDVYLSGLLCYANMISVGTTCFAEAGGPHPDAMARAAVDTGIRGFVSLNTIDQGEHWPKSHDHHHQEGARRQCRAGQAVGGHQGRPRPRAGHAVAAPDHDLHARS
jgi:cytosine/adenosine deaminase-related metal-dependent hydrolase